MTHFAHSNRMGSGLRGHDIGEAIKHLTTLQGNKTALDQITKATTSCIRWGSILQELMQKDSITNLSVKQPEHTELYQIGEELRAGKAVLVALKLSDCVFCIEPRAGGCLARIVHAWQDIQSVRTENYMPIEEMIDHMKGLWFSDCVADRKKLQNIFENLFGTDYPQFKSNVRPVRPKIPFEMVLSGRPKQPLDDSQRLSSLLSEISVWKSVELSTAVRDALGFVFGVGSVLISGERDPKEVPKQLDKLIVGGATGGTVGAAATKFLAPTFSSIGASVVRANVLSGVAFVSVFAIWDVVEWKMDKITEVQLRQRMAEGLAGAAGGIGGGMAAGAGFGLLFGPIGALAGGIVGGLAGGIGGAFAGKAIDGAIWDGNEDSVMNMYKFFGWHDVKRNERPKLNAEEMEEAYKEKLKSRPPEIKKEDWDQICMAWVIVLLGARYPVFTEVMKMADNLQKNRSDGVSAIGTAMCQSKPVE